MNPQTPKPNRDEIEVRLTALLLGELSLSEAELLRWTIAQDVELTRLHDRLKNAIDLVREVTAHPETAAEQPGVPFRLSEERRQKLLARFKTVAPREFAARKPRWNRPWLLRLAAVLVASGLLAGLWWPAFMRDKEMVLSMSDASSNVREEAQMASQSPGPSRITRKVAFVPRDSDSISTVSQATPPGVVVGGLNAPAPAPVLPPIYLGDNGAKFQTGDRLDVAAVSSGASGTSLQQQLGVNNRGGGGGGGGGNAMDGRVEPALVSPQRPMVASENEAPANNLPPAGPEGEFAFNDNASKDVNRSKSGVADNFGNLHASLRGYSNDDAKSEPLTQKETSVDKLSPPQSAMVMDSPAVASLSEPMVASVPALPAGSGLPVEAPPSVVASPTAGAAGLISTFSGEGGEHSVDRQLRDQRVETVWVTNGVACATTPSAEDIQAIQIATASDGLMEGMKADSQKAAVSPPPASMPILGDVPVAGTLFKSADRRPAPQTPAGDDRPAKKETPAVTVAPPEVFTKDNVFSTFSLNVSDVSFKLAAASLAHGVMPPPGGIRSEEFINAFDYRDPEPPAGVPVGFAWERVRDPFAHNRDLLRFAIKTAAEGRQPGRPLNLVLLLDKSGSMERADRVAIIQAALRVLAAQLQPHDTLSVVTFARTARLWVDGVPGSQAEEVFGKVGRLTPQGGTNLEEAMRLAYETARRHFQAGGLNRVVLLTDGAANLGEVDPQQLKRQVEVERKQGVALDCFGIGWEDYNDDLLEVLSSHGDGRYGFLNTPEEAAAGFGTQLAGALKVAAADVKVQVEFNPRRVTAYRQIGYASHQLTREQFRDNTVDAAVIGAAESGNALYTVQINAQGEGPVATVRVRFRTPGTERVQEHAWSVPYTGTAVALDRAGPAMRLASVAGLFAEWLSGSPYAAEVTPNRLLPLLQGVPQVYGTDPRPKQLEAMLLQTMAVPTKAPGGSGR